MNMKRISLLLLLLVLVVSPVMAQTDDPTPSMEVVSSPTVVQTDVPPVEVSPPSDSGAWSVRDVLDVIDTMILGLAIGAIAWVLHNTTNKLGLSIPAEAWREIRVAGSNVAQRGYTDVQAFVEGTDTPLDDAVFAFFEPLFKQWLERQNKPVPPNMDGSQ